MIYNKLYPWQKRIVDKFKVRHNFGLFLDMGLGKTPISLGLAEANNCTKCIVITINPKAMEPQSIEGSWLDWGSQSGMNYELASKKLKVAFNNDIAQMFLINYEALYSRAKDKKAKVELSSRVKEFVDSCKGHNVAIIVDESHKMKNLSSIQTLAINRIKRELKFRATNVYTYLLTGTPFTTGYIDLYSQLKTLGYDETKGQFCDQFCVRGNLPGLLGWQQPIIGYQNIEQLFRTVHRYAITIDSEDVADLPDKIFVNHTTSMSEDFDVFVHEFVKGEKIISTYHRQKKDISDNPMWAAFHIDEFSKKYAEHKQPNPFFRNIDYPNFEYLAESGGTFWLRARQLSIGFQGNASSCVWFDRRRLEQLRTFLERNEDNYVLFYNFTPELLEIYDICEELGYNVDVYCGEIKSLHFYETYSKQTEAEKLTNKKNIILANFASGSTGMNWQAYNSNIIFSIPLYKDWAQALKRTHRTGQTKTVFYHLFFQNNWLDNGMRKSLDEGTEYNSNMFESDLTRVENIMKEV